MGEKSKMEKAVTIFAAIFFILDGVGCAVLSAFFPAMAVLALIDFFLAAALIYYLN